VRLRPAIARLLAPLARLVTRRLPVRDAWERYDYRVPLSAFGSGNRHEFGWYFEGESSVAVASLDEVQEWLLACEYVQDESLFNEPDFWQHPRTFEQLRRGDCEDHALWAWRKLVELGYDADLVSGTVLRATEDTAERGGHVWVMLRENGERLVFEAVAKAKSRMVRPLEEVRDRYRPEFGVDRQRQRYAFNGALLAFNEHRSSSTRRSA
jgi:Bacterial transglutaminase-like cysteine proteinase BTLCP